MYHGFKTYDFSMKARERIVALDDAADLRLVKLRIQLKFLSFHLLFLVYYGFMTNQVHDLLALEI